MAEFKGFFDAVAGSPDYDSAEEALTRDSMATGVMPDFDNELEVTAGTGLQVNIDSGFLWHLGRYYYQTEPSSGGSPKTLSLDAATAGSNRQDLIIVEFDVTTPAITLKVSKGTETTGTPTPPTLADDEALLATVDITGSTLNSVIDGRNIQGARVNIPTPTYYYLERGTSDQTSGTQVEFENAIEDDDSIWSISNASQLPVDADGKWTFNFRIYFESTIYTTYAITNAYIFKNTNIIENSKIVWLGGVGMWQGSITLDLEDGDYLAFQPATAMSASNKVLQTLCHVDVIKS